MAMGGMHDLPRYLFGENMWNGVNDEIVGIRLAQEADLDALDIDKITGPAPTHIAHHLGATEEECQVGTVLDDAAKPIEEQIEVDRPFFLCIFELFEFVEREKKRAVDLFQCSLYFGEPLFKEIVDLELILLLCIVELAAFELLHWQASVPALLLHSRSEGSEKRSGAGNHARRLSVVENTKIAGAQQHDELVQNATFPHPSLPAEKQRGT